MSRQDCGTLGNVGTCQVGVFLADPALLGTALVDHRRSLPDHWRTDRVRCAAAGVPTDVTCQTTAELGLAMLRQVRQHRTRGAGLGGSGPQSAGRRRVAGAPAARPIAAMLAAGGSAPGSP